MLILAGCFAVVVHPLAAQNSIKLFGPVAVSLSLPQAGYGSSQVIFNSNTLNLACPAKPVAVLSSTPDGTGNLLVDNNIDVTVTTAGEGDSIVGPIDVCAGGNPYPIQNCFNYTYEGEAWSILGQDPDNYVGTGGVPPIDISSYLTEGNQSVEIDLVDEGVIFTGSTVYLDTNCKSKGVTGPAVVVNPVPPGTTTQPTTENFGFNPTPGQTIDFFYTLPTGVDVPSGLLEQVSDSGIDPTTFEPTWVSGTPGTSFATSNCLVHAGELVNGLPACKLYTLLCTTSTNSTPSGANCAYGATDSIFGESFDPPASYKISLPDISTHQPGSPGTPGPTFHEGMGLLMATDTWTGGTCQFAEPSLSGQLCPQNLLYSFQGPGSVNNNGRSTQPNSTFISVYGVPEDLTTIGGLRPGNWTNSTSPNVTFTSVPPDLADANSPPPNAASFVPAPIQTISYGVTPPSGTVPLPINEPIAADTVLTNPAGCPNPATPNTPAAVPFTPPAQPLSLTNGDGTYLLHYYAQDCAGTQELKFTFAPSVQYPSGTWSTSFYTVPVKLDTVNPVASSITLSPPTGPYTRGQTVTASYSCTDDNSGVVTCGTHKVGATTSTGTLTGPLDTSSLGNKTFTVTAVDAAGNTSAPQSVNYTVLAAVPAVSITTTATLVKSLPNYVATVTVTNTGTGTANNVKLTSALLGAALGSTLPATVGTGTLTAGASANVTITFPAGTAGSSGASVTEKYAGSYTGGSFSSSIHATLP